VLLSAGSPTSTSNVPTTSSASPHTTASKVELAALQIELDTLLQHAHSVAAVQQAIRAHDEIVAATNNNNNGVNSNNVVINRSPSAVVRRASATSAGPTAVSTGVVDDLSMRRLSSKSPPPPVHRAPSFSSDASPPSLPPSGSSTLKLNHSPGLDDQASDDSDTLSQDYASRSNGSPKSRPDIPPTPPSEPDASPPPVPHRVRPTPPRVPPPLAPLPPALAGDQGSLKSALVDKIALNGSPKRDSPKRDSPKRDSPGRSRDSPGRSSPVPLSPTIDSPSRRKASSRRPSAPSTPKADSSRANKKLSSSRKEKKSSRRDDKSRSSQHSPAVASAVAASPVAKKSPKVVVNLRDSDDDDSEQRLLRALEAEALEASNESSHASDDDTTVNASTVLNELFGLLRNGETERFIQLAENWHSALDFNRRDPNGRTLLCLAATVGDADTTQRLLTLGAKPSATTALGSSPLHCAAYHGRAAVCSLLLELDIEASAANKHGLTPLHCAVSSNQHHVIPLLVNAGAAFAARDANGSTPLHVACTLGHVASVRALLRAIEGTKPDGIAALASALAAKDDAELTPLMSAVWQNHANCVELLVRHGAKNDADRDGLTPLSIASDDAIKQILVRAFVSGGDDAPAGDDAGASSSAAPESGSLSARRRHREAEDARRRKQSVPAIAASSASGANGAALASPSQSSARRDSTVQDQEASVSFEGALLVREGALRKQWVERYATLANGELSCYADKVLAKTGSDPLWFVTVDETVELVPLKDGKAAHAELSFSLLVRNKTVLLRAKTPEDKLTWVNKINLLKYSRQHGGTAGLHLLAREASGQQRSISSSGERGGTFFRVPSQQSKSSPLSPDKSQSRRPLAVPALDLTGAGVKSAPTKPAADAAAKHDDDDDGVLDSSESETDNMPVPTVNLSKADRRKSIRRLQHDSGMDTGGHHHHPHKSPRELSPRFKLPHVPTRRAVASRRAAAIAKGEDPDADPDDDPDEQQ
jgi:ankyrin repeat protein